MKPLISTRPLSALLLAAILSTTTVAHAAQSEQAAQADQSQKAKQTQIEKRTVHIAPMAAGTELSHDEFIDRIGAPPMITDAPDAAEEGVKKVAVWFDTDRASDGSSATEMPHVSYTIGIGHDTEIGIEAPFVQNQAADGSKISGYGKQAVGVKSAIYENNDLGLNVGVGAGFSSDIPFTNSAAKGVTAPGNHVQAKFLISKQVGPMITIANVGYDHLMNPNPDQVGSPDTVSSSVAAGIRYNPRLAFMAEVAQTNDANNMNSNVTRVVNIGTIYKWNKNITVFASLGKSLGTAADGLTHTYALAGLSYEWEGDGDGRARLARHHLWKLNDNDGKAEPQPAN